MFKMEDSKNSKKLTNAYSLSPITETRKVTLLLQFQLTNQKCSMTSKTAENIEFCTPDVKQALYMCMRMHEHTHTHVHNHNHHYFFLSSHPSACALKLETNSSVLSGIQLTIKQVFQPGPLAKHVGVM